LRQIEANLGDLKVLALVVDYQSAETSEAVIRDLEQIAIKHPELSIAWIQQGREHAFVGHDRAHSTHVIAGPENRGYAGAINHALKQLPRPDILWVLNADVRVETHAYTAMIEMFETHPRAGAVGPRIMNGHPTARKLWGARGVVDPILGRTAMVDWPATQAHRPLPFWSYVPGACLMIRMAAYEDAGGLPEVYFLYYEETELCIRLQQKGWELYCASTAEVQHDVASRAHRIPAPHYAYYFVRNNLLFWRRCFGFSNRSQWPRLFVFVFLKEMVLPLRRAPSWAIAKDRLRWAIKGLRESTKL
jgi:GT2 family glycosyltransferase